MALPPISVKPDDIEADRLRLQLRFALLQAQDSARENFLDFARYVWPSGIVSPHHQKMANAFDRIIDGTLKRLIVNMPPRHTKSEYSSYLLPAYAMGRKPDLKIIQATHTAELAVRFGRKARNLMDTETFKEVFPDVVLKADSKAAGRWDTNQGGEYFACILPTVGVHTPRGIVPAGDICPGDRLLNCGAGVTVRRVYYSRHDETVDIAGLCCSVKHPIWTMNRGWVYAGEVEETDLLCVESIFDKIGSQLRSIYGTLEHTPVQAVVRHQVALFKPKQRKVSELWRAWDYGLRTLVSVLEFCSGHGGAAFARTHCGEDRQQWSIQPRQLPVGNTSSTREQQAFLCDDRDFNNDATCTDDGDFAPSSSLSKAERAGSTGAEEDVEELGTYHNPTNLGWVRCAAASVVVGSVKRVSQSVSRPQGYMACIGKTAQDLLGFLLGVRRAGFITRTAHPNRGFVNFLTDGDHTFFADGILTHNCGVGSAMTGRGANLLIVDDPHAEGDALSTTAYDNAYEWYTSGPRQRLQPGGAIVIVATRWSTKDLPGRLINAQASHNADKWEVIEFPAIFDEGLPTERPLWPAFWKLEELQAVRASLSVQKWQAQWQQNPTSDEGAILKRDWWRKWTKDYTPQLDYVIQSYDTAYSKKETADYSAITTWGVFTPDIDSGPNILLLNVKKGRWDFPELKRIAKEEYAYWQPDNVLIEAKATGTTLQQELRKVGIPVTMYSPGGRRAGQDKISRANAIATLLESGMVWAPDTDWADDLIEECAAFPNGDNDDLVDSTVMALARFRTGNFVILRDDERETKEEPKGIPEYY